MDDFRRRRADLEALTDRLIVEYTGALPPGQILAAVVRAHRQLLAGGTGWTADRAALCESLAREHLTQRLAPLASSG